MIPVVSKKSGRHKLRQRRRLDGERVVVVEVDADGEAGVERDLDRLRSLIDDDSSRCQRERRPVVGHVELRPVEHDVDAAVLGKLNLNARVKTTFEELITFESYLSIHQIIQLELIMP